MPPHRLLLLGVLLTLGIGWGSTQSLGKIAVSTGHGFFGLIFWQLVIGALVLVSLQTGMVLIGFGDGSYRKIVIGAALVIAVWLDIVYRKRIK